MLELIFQGFIEWTYGLILECWEYFSSMLLNVMSMDFAYLKERMPVIQPVMQTMLALGWALLIGNLVFQAVRSMMTGLGFEAEDPKLLFGRTFVFSFLLVASPQICNIALNMTSTVIELLELPDGTLSQYRQELAGAEQTLTRTHDSLCELSRHRDVLERAMQHAQSEIQLHRVELSDESLADGAVRLMVGWTLEKKATALTQWLDRQGIYYDIEDPAFDEDVPVKITNNSFSSLFEPILRMYSLPSYQDLDPTFYFAPFFMLFFGLCLGDGGYGLLVLIGGLLLAWKGTGDMKSYGRLGAWLGGMTVVCGLATGTVFGMDLTQQDWAFLAPVKRYFLSDNGVSVDLYNPQLHLVIDNNTDIDGYINGTLTAEYDDGTAPVSVIVPATEGSK